MTGSMEEYFSTMQAYSEEHNAQTKFTGRNYLTLSRKSMSDSTSIIRIIRDPNNKPMRLIHDMYECWINQPVLDENGQQVYDATGNVTYAARKYYVAGLSNFKNLPADDIKLVTDTKDMCDRFLDIYGRDGDDLGSSVTHRKEVSLWWGKLISFTGDQKNISGTGLVYRMSDHGNTFFKDFCEAINSKNAMKGSGAWLEKYLDREPGKHEEACSIKVHLGDSSKGEQLGYSHVFTFDTVAPYELTVEDIEAATDLDRELVNVVEFNRDLYTTVLNYLKGVVEAYDMKSATDMGLTAAEEAPKVDAQTAYANQGTATPTPTPQPTAKPSVAPPRPTGAPVPPMGPPTSL